MLKTLLHATMVKQECSGHDLMLGVISVSPELELSDGLHKISATNTVGNLLLYEEIKPRSLLVFYDCRLIEEKKGEFTYTLSFDRVSLVMPCFFDPTDRVFVDFNAAVTEFERESIRRVCLEMCRKDKQQTSVLNLEDVLEAGDGDDSSCSYDDADLRN